MGSGSSLPNAGNACAPRVADHVSHVILYNLNLSQWLAAQCEGRTDSIAGHAALHRLVNGYTNVDSNGGM